MNFLVGGSLSNRHGYFQCSGITVPDHWSDTISGEIDITVNVLKRNKKALNLISLLTSEAKGSNKVCKGRQFPFAKLVTSHTEFFVFSFSKFYCTNF